MTELPLVKLPHFVTVEDLSSEQVLSLIHRAEFYKDGGEMPKITKPVYVTNAFFENSTRTHTSFEVAETKPSRRKKKGKFNDCISDMKAISIIFLLLSSF